MTWTHAALRYKPDAPGTSWRVIEATMVGIKDRSWADFIADKEGVQLYQVKGGLPEATSREIVAYGSGNVGKRYAFWWLGRIAWRLFRRRFPLGVMTYPSHVCSSLVYNCFLYGSIDLIPGHEGVLVTPDEIVSSSLLEEAPLQEARVQLARG
jgi:hypothetical protein